MNAQDARFLEDLARASDDQLLSQWRHWRRLSRGYAAGVHEPIPAGWPLSPGREREALLSSARRFRRDADMTWIELRRRQFHTRVWRDAFGLLFLLTAWVVMYFGWGAWALVNVGVAAVAWFPGWRLAWRRWRSGYRSRR